ncbi:MAG: GNAT family N-acetyltransferase [Chloroflexota bacterium]
MNNAIKAEDFKSLFTYWTNPNYGLNWSSVFVIPGFLESWWHVFGNAAAELSICSVWQNEEIAGIAPLQINNSTASFIGNADVCDYIDFITVPGKEDFFFGVLLDALKQKGISGLDLGPVRPDASVMTSLTGIARKRGYEATCQKEDVFLEMVLPATWDEYLGMLGTKQRHELRRKIRRLAAAGKIDYQVVASKDSLSPDFDTFLRLFARSRGHKAAFMTDRMTVFFRTLTLSLTEAGLMRFGILRLPPTVLAMVMCFDYHGVVYLYNSAYDPDYSHLSPGILSKAFYIQNSIANNRGKFNFLKGSEDYKSKMGGEETDIYRCHIAIK